MKKTIIAKIKQRFYIILLLIVLALSAVCCFNYIAQDSKDQDCDLVSLSWKIEAINEEISKLQDEKEALIEQQWRILNTSITEGGHNGSIRRYDIEPDY